MDLKLKLFPDGLSTGMLIFDLTANNGSLVNPLSATREEMLAGKNVTVNDNVTEVYATPQGACSANKLTMIVPVVEGTLADVDITSVDQATLTSVRAIGEVVSTGTSTVTDHGFVYSKNHMPTVDDLVNCTKVSVGSGTGTFEKVITGLTSNTVYYFRAYAKNDKGTIHSTDELTLSTLASGVGEQDPTITLNPIFAIDAPSAKASGVLTNPNNLFVIELGVCWGTTENPIYTGNKNVATIVTGTGGGVYDATLNPLVTDAIYFVRAFVRYRNTAGVEKVAYSINTPSVQFKAVDVPVITKATISIDPVVVDGATTASSGGTVLTDGGGTFLLRGLCWSTVPNPEMPAALHSDNGSTLGHFVTQMVGLTTGIQYYVRAYVQNDAGYGYSDVQLTFTPKAIVVYVKPTVAFTKDVVAESATSAHVYAAITNDGGKKITQRGFMYIKNTDQVGGNSTPDYTNPAFNATVVAFTEPNPIGPFEKIITGLQTGVQYNFYAYAVNDAGLWDYSAMRMIILSVDSGKPRLLIIAADATDTSCLVVVNVYDVTLGSVLAGYKVMWGLNAASMVNTQLGQPLYTVDSGGTPLIRFKALLTGLTPNRGYSIQASASNTVGEGLSQVEPFTTSAIVTTPITITMVEATILNRTDVHLVGNVTVGNNLMVKGFCWALSPAVPTKGAANFIERSTSIDGGVYFEDAIGLLSPGKTYNFKAYAQNSLSGGALVYSANMIAGTTNTIGIPTISQMASPTFKSYDTAAESAQVTNDGGSAILECGFMWGRTITPVLEPYLGKLYPRADYVFPAPVPTTLGIFGNDATGIEYWPETGWQSTVDYMVVPYAINAAGGAVGAPINASVYGPFNPAFQNVAAISAGVVRGSGSNSGTAGVDLVASWKVIYSKNSDFSASLEMALPTFAFGNFTFDVTGLDSGVDYYFKLSLVWDGPYTVQKTIETAVRYLQTT